MGGGSQPAQTTQINKVELPAWVNQASEENYNLAKNIAGMPLQQYEGQQVASPGAMTTQGYDAIQSSLGATQPLYDQAVKSLESATALQNQANPFFTKAGGLQDKAVGILDQTQPLYGKATGALDAATPLLGQAAGAYGKAGGSFGEAADIYRGTAGDLDVNKFLNPYTNEVENRAIANAETALQKTQLGVTDAARAAGAFGGSRHGIQSGVAQAEGVRGIGDLSAALRKAGIDYATSTAIADRAGKQAAGAGMLGVGQGQLGQGAGYLNTAAGLGNQAAGYGNVAAGLQNTAGGVLNAGQQAISTGAGLLGAAGTAQNTAAGYGNTAAGKQAASQTDIGNLLAGGAQQQAQSQAEIDAAMKQFYEKRDYPLQGLNTRLAALGMSPYGKTETTTKTGTSENRGTDWATVGLGALRTLPALLALSDRNTKTDIKKLTDGPVPLYAYRYKGDPKSYPKIVGPMAQDIEKVRPSAVKRVGKHKVVDINNLMEVLS